ncbi:hypothetical protein MTO96_025729 [Rhipicephalus appendiculatus]
MVQLWNGCTRRKFGTLLYRKVEPPHRCARRRNPGAVHAGATVSVPACTQRVPRKDRQPEMAMREARRHPTASPPARLYARDAGLTQTHAPLTDFLWKVSAHCWTPSHSPTACTRRGERQQRSRAQAGLHERSLFLSTGASPSSRP